MKDIYEMTAKEKKELLSQLQREDKEEKIQRRDAYEGLRAQFMHDVFSRVEPLAESVAEFRDWIDKESDCFKTIMAEYCQLKNDNQKSFTIVDGDTKLEVRSNSVKGFDERADAAAERLIDYLKKYAEKSDNGSEDPMYQLAMTLLERNKMGKLDYKSISKLYAMEGRFDGEYSEIMDLFRESNVVNDTVTNFYFSKKDKDNVWRRLEPSFCRM